MESGGASCVCCLRYYCKRLLITLCTSSIQKEIFLRLHLFHFVFLATIRLEKILMILKSLFVIFLQKKIGMIEFVLNWILIN